MREIKFRAWDDERKEMIYNGYLKKRREESLKNNPKALSRIIYLMLTLDDGLRYCNDNGTMVETSFCGDKWYLMQYTGLKDKHGKEIYEGDIVVLTHTSTDTRINFFNIIERVVEFKNGGFYITRPQYADYFLSDFEEKEIEVIGNIHENPYFNMIFRKLIK